MTLLALIGPPDLVSARIAAVQGVYRIGRGELPGVAVSFDPGDERRRQNLLAWFERGAEPGATLLIDDWKLCRESDPGLADSVRWIAATARETKVVITARSLDDLPDRLPLQVEVLDFLSLHGLGRFTKALAWKGRWWKVPIGVDSRGEPVVVELTHFADGKWRTGSHLSVTKRESFRSLLLGLMTTHSPKLFQAILIDARDSGMYAGLDQAPHVQAHHRDVARDPVPLAEALLAESERRLEIVGNTWTIFDHRGFDQVLPQLLICVNGFADIRATELGAAIATIAQDVGKSGMQLLLDAPCEATDVLVGDCTAPANLDELARELPRLMRRAEPSPDFFTLHETPSRFDRAHAWRSRPVKIQYRAAVGTDEHGQRVEIDIKSSALQDGMGPHGEVVAPAERRADGIRALVLGQMLRHSPDELQVVFVDLDGTEVFAGLENAPHVRAVDLLEDHERRTRTLADSGYRNTWDYRAARSNGAELAPLPELLVCVDGPVEAHPELMNVLRTLGQTGRTYGQHLLLSGATARTLPDIHTSYRLEFGEQGWTRRIGRSVESFVLPTDLDDVTRSLPIAMRG